MARTTQTDVAPAESGEAPKAKKPNAREQGVPEVYLGEGGNFRPGYDAKMKSDLITAVLGSPVLHEWDPQEALAVLEARGWTRFLDESRAARERKAAK